MKYKLRDLIDVEQLQYFQDRLNEILPFPSTIMDKDGTILTATAWQDICTKFHRRNRDCERDCLRSDMYLHDHIAEADPAVQYACPRGLVDCAVPIIIEGVHYGSFFTGQVFLEAPDLEYFGAQAARFGFDEQAYLEAVRKVPVWSQHQLDNYILLIKGLIDLIANFGAKQLKEIEDRKIIEESESRAENILQKMLDAFWVVDAQTAKIVEVNNAMCQMLGYSQGELLSMSVSDVDANDDPAGVKKRIGKIIEQGSASFESRFRRKDGSLIDVDISVSFLPERNSFFGFHRDITDRKRIEAALRESEAGLRFSQRVAHVGHWTWDVLTNKVTYSDEVYRIFGLDPETFDGDMAKVIDHAIHPDDRDKVNASNEAVINSATPVPLEYRVIWPDQSVHTVWAEAGEKEFDENGKIIKLSGIVQDISERKRAEAALVEREKQFRLLAENSTDMISRHSPDGIYLYVSPACQRLLGYTPGELVGRHAYEFVHPDSITEVDTSRTQIIGQPIINTTLFRACRKDGSYVWMETTSKAVFDEETGQVIEIHASTRDVSTRMQTEEALRESEEKLRGTFNAMEEGMALNELVFDENGEVIDYRILEVNPAFEQLSFLNREQVIGRLATEIYHMDPEYIRTFWAEHLHADDAIKTDMYIPEIKRWRHISTSKVTDNKFTTIFFDNTDQKNAELALRESEERYHNFITQSFEAIYRSEFDHPIDTTLPVEEQIDLIYEYAYMAECNPALAEMYGMRVEDLIGFRLVEAHGGKDNPVNRAAFRRLIENGYRTLNDETLEYDAQGQPIWFLSNTVGTVENGQLIRLWGTAINITERKRAEEQLVESENRFSSAFAFAPIGMALVSPEGNWLKVNQAVCEILGYTQQELLATNFQAVTHPEDLEPDLEYVQQMLNGDIKTYQMQKRYIHKSGKIVWALLSVSLIRDKDGVPQYFISQMIDITAQKLSEEALRESEARYRAVVSNAPLVTFVTDDKGVFTLSEGKGLSKLGLQPGQVVGLQVSDVYKDYPKILSCLDIALSGQPARQEVEVMGVLFEAFYIPVIDELGSVSKVIGVANDITERKQVEAEIRRLNSELEHRVAQRTRQLEIANKELESFSYSISHDLRAPLRAIDGFSRILSEEYARQLPPEAINLLEVVRSNAQQMGRLIEGLLGFSRLGRQDLNKQLVRSSVLVQQAIDILENERAGRQVDITVGEMGTCDGDPTLLAQVWVNLLSNALKYTRQRPVAQIEIGSQADGSGGRIYYIKDNGVGFDMRYADKLFGVFQRLHSVEEFEGTGVGLALVKRIIQRHGGNIWVTAEPDKGAAFYFSLP